MKLCNDCVRGIPDLVRRSRTVCVNPQCRSIPNAYFYQLAAPLAAGCTRTPVCAGDKGDSAAIDTMKRHYLKNVDTDTAPMKEHARHVSGRMIPQTIAESRGSCRLLLLIRPSAIPPASIACKSGRIAPLFFAKRYATPKNCRGCYR